jgi:hypothetical protein
MAYVHAEIASQPDCWRKRLAAATVTDRLLPRRAGGRGLRHVVAWRWRAVPCEAGQGETDAFGPPSSGGQRYRLIAITSASTTGSRTSRRCGQVPTTVLAGEGPQPR